MISVPKGGKTTWRKCYPRRPLGLLGLAPLGAPGDRAFVRDGSIYDEAPTIWYSPAGGRAWPLCGTVVFSKLNLRSRGALSRRVVSYLLKVLTFGPDGLIRLSHGG